MERQKYVPIARLENSVLVIRENDLPKIGKGPESLEVKAVVVDLDKREALGPELLERHLKFNPWEEVSPDQYSQLMHAICQALASNKLDEIFSN